MARLTYKNANGTYGLNNGYDMQKVPAELQGALWKLKDYEETGLSPEEAKEYKDLGFTPEQIREIDKLYLEKCKEVNVLAAELEELRKKYSTNTNVGSSDWIPCSKKLPEESDSIFAKFKETDKWNNAMFEKSSDVVNVTVADEKGKVTTTHAHTIDGKWSCSLLGCNKTFKIIAWQPLPEPYKESEEQYENVLVM